MPRLTYYYAQCLNDDEAYSIRERTLKEAKAKRDEWDPKQERFGPIHRITMEYEDAFDLFSTSVGEGGPHSLTTEERLARGEKHANVKEQEMCGCVVA